MIDTFLLIFTLGIVMYICGRAVLLDRELPWFPPLSKPGQGRPTDVGWRRPATSRTDASARAAEASVPSLASAAGWKRRPRDRQASR